ncbi:unnamed protein product [Notodromas monacha]|uniref:SAM domain-containing protein n=1 Tax=Notodromas monacha TaxID=399045 RepID=A0A7R9BYR7_9CRUS|nr:unnamed protein product [Notodromas monacha]CAG0923071.1 unnamed protein product [Notodromas monacha]
MSNNTANTSPSAINWFTMLEKWEGLDVVDLPDMDIFAAASTGAVNKVLELLRRDNSLATKRNRGGWTALMYASHSNHVKIMETLVQAAPICVNMLDLSRRSALTLASMWGHDDAVRLLLTWGAELETKDEILDYSPLHHAVVMGHLSTVETLLSHGADPSPRERFSRSTPLMSAAFSGQEQMSVFLLSHMTLEDIRAVNIDGDTAYDLACKNMHIDLAEIIQQFSSGDIGSYFPILPTCIRNRPELSDASSNSSVFVDDEEHPDIFHWEHASSGANVIPSTTSTGIFAPDEELERTSGKSRKMSLRSFLAENGMSQYLNLFREQEIDLGVFLTMSDEDLKSIGITKLGARKRMTSAIARWHSCAFPKFVRKHGITALEMAYADKLQAENDELRIKLAGRIHQVETMQKQLLGLKMAANRVFYELQRTVDPKMMSKCALEFLMDLKVRTDHAN